MICIITGGTGVIGQQIATMLLEHGATVILASRSQERGQNALEALNASDDRCLFYSVDVKNIVEVEQFFQWTLEKFQQIDILINGAGSYGEIGLSYEVNPVQWKSAIDDKLLGTFYFCHFALKQMVHQKSGKIINIAGGGATDPLQNLSSYAASNAAVTRFTETVAVEVAPFNIHVNTILPGAIDTPLQDQLLDAGEKAGPWYPKIKELREKGVGGVSPNKTAELVKFLLFGLGATLTGKTLSARYDNFSSWSAEQIEQVAQSNLFSLRRVDAVSLKVASELQNIL